MKKVLFSILVVVCMFSVCACNSDTKTGNKTEVCAFVEEIENDVIVIDIAEYITNEDTERIEELKLTDLDMINGYYINNSEVELEEYTLTEETVYNFIDWKNDFVEEGENREFSTTNKEDFIKYLDTYENSRPQMPFFFEVADNEVISITEKIMM
ncbi:MAG: hypothetical protein IJC39_04625 [Firmicutes bacterium]|nr:hypothetical protein [Bacillota bacterium]